MNQQSKNILMFAQNTRPSVNPAEDQLFLFPGLEKGFKKAVFCKIQMTHENLYS